MRYLLLFTIAVVGCSYSNNNYTYNGQPKDTITNTEAPKTTTNGGTATSPIQEPEITWTDFYKTEIATSLPIAIADNKEAKDLINKWSNNNIYTTPLRLYFETSTKSAPFRVSGRLFMFFADPNGRPVVNYETEVLGSGSKSITADTESTDIMFSDYQLAFRIQTTKSGNTSVGKVYFRFRTLNDWSYCPTEDQYRNVCVGTNVQVFPQDDGRIFCDYGTYQSAIDILTPCRNFMSPTNPNVKLLGTF